MPGADSTVAGDDDTLLARPGRRDSGLEHALGDLRPGGDDDEDEVRAQVLAGLGVAQQKVRLGRYRLGTALGKGGAGAVFEAEDERLGRKVAVKLVRARVTAAEDATMAQRRLLREARAAARLSHPNVVKVFDVGRYDRADVEGLGIEVASEGVYLVLELVEGVDLRAWLTTPRAPDAVLDVMRRAGRGLAAAHDAGLVHRDFKPANVLVCRDGAVKVADFGLARISDSSASGGSGEHEESAMSVLTEAGLIVGTLPYMAPEQQEGEATPASDQYSFCIALFEALVGQRPFRGSAVDSYAAKVTGQIPETPTLQPWVRSVVARGLKPAPTDRYPSMRALLIDLQPPKPRRGGWAWLLGFGLLATLALALPDDSCTPALHRADALVSASRDAGTVAVDQAAATLEGWSAYCEALEQSSAETDELRERSECLEQRTAERMALVELWHAKRLNALELGQALEGLTPVSTCADTRRHPGRLPPPPAEVAAEVRRVRARLAGANAQLEAGRIDHGLADARVALQDARTLDYAPLVVEARVAVASGELKRGRVDAAARELEAAYWAGSELDHFAQMATAASMLAYLNGKVRRDPANATVWERHAEVAMDRAASPMRARASLTNVMAANRQAAGDLSEAARLFERAIVELEEAGGDRRAEIALILNNLGEIRSAAGHYAQADAALARSEAIRRERFGPQHPVIASTLVHQAMNARRQEKTNEAIALYHQALAVLEESEPGRHPWRPTVLLNLGAVYGVDGEFDKAADAFQLAIDQHEREGTRDVGWAGLHKNLAAARQGQERWTEAREHYQLALPLFPLRDLRRAQTLAGLAEVALGQGDLDAAGSYASEAGAAAEHARPHPPLTKRIEEVRAQLQAR